MVGAGDCPSVRRRLAERAKTAPVTAAVRTPIRYGPNYGLNYRPSVRTPATPIRLPEPKRVSRCLTTPPLRVEVVRQHRDNGHADQIGGAGKGGDG